MTSLHDPKYTSLRAQYALPNYQRRLLNLTSDEISMFKHDVALAADHWQRKTAHGPDFAGIIDGIVQRKTVQYPQMMSFLSKKNRTEGFTRTKFLAYGGFTTYFDTAETLSTDIPANVRHMRLRKGIETCKQAMTRHLITVTPQENRLKRAIEVVRERICEFEGSILLDASDMNLLDVKVTEEAIEASGLMERWQSELEDLMRWLGWSTWMTCEGGCGDDVSAMKPQSG